MLMFDDAAERGYIYTAKRYRIHDQKKAVECESFRCVIALQSNFSWVAHQCSVEWRLSRASPS